MQVQTVEFGSRKITIKSEPDSDTTYISRAGNVVGKPAGDVIVGDCLVWNGGATSLVLAITKETDCYVTLLEEFEGAMGGIEQGERRFRKDRIIAIAH